MQIDGIKGQVIPFPGVRRQAAGDISLAAIESDHALVPVTPADPSDRSRRNNPRDPAFLAQLIAAKDQPQARQLRRAEPAEALSAYRTALSTKLANGQNFVRES